MARITDKERELKKAKYDKAILDILLNEGWDKVSYRYLASKVKVSHTSLQNYYPNQSDFLSAIQGKVFPVFIQFIDKDNIEQSWNNALHQPVFTRLLNLLFINLTTDNPHPLAQQGLERLKTFIGNDELFERLLGKALLHIIRNT